MKFSHPDALAVALALACSAAGRDATAGLAQHLQQLSKAIELSVTAATATGGPATAPAPAPAAVAADGAAASDQAASAPIKKEHDQGDAPASVAVAPAPAAVYQEPVQQQQQQQEGLVEDAGDSSEHPIVVDDSDADDSDFERKEDSDSDGGSDSDGSDSDSDGSDSDSEGTVIPDADAMPAPAPVGSPKSPAAVPAANAAVAPGAPVKGRKPSGGKAASTAYTFESLGMHVEEVPLERKGGSSSKQPSVVKVTEAQLERLRKMACLALNPGTEAEGQHASRRLEAELAKHNLSRKELLESVVEDGTDASYFNAAGRWALVISHMRQMPVAYWNLMHGVRNLMRVRHYRTKCGDGSMRFTFYGSADAACSAAHLFGELVCASKTMAMAYTVPAGCNVQLKHARTSYVEGLASGYEKLTAQLKAQRDDLTTEQQAQLQQLVVYDDKVLALASKAVKADTNFTTVKAKDKCNVHFDSFFRGKEDAKKLSTGKTVQ
jgi:hypothetical protein